MICSPPSAAIWPRLQEQIADGSVELATLIVGRTHNQCTLACLVCGQIFPGDGLVPVLGYGDFTHAILVLEEHQGVSDPAFRGKRYGLPKVRVALAPDDFEAGDGHARLLHLIDGTPCFDCMMLSLVADEHDALDVLIAPLVQKSVHVACGEET